MNSWRDRLSSGLPRFLVAAHDLAMVWVCWQVLHHLRYAMVAHAPDFPVWSNEILIVLLAQGAVFWWMGLYRGLWRFASLPDLWNIVKACALGFLGIVVGLFFYNRFGSTPRAVLGFYPFALVGFLGLPRLIYRAWKDSQVRRAQDTSSRVIILGAGRAGEALVRELRRTGVYHPVAFLDDAARLHGSKLQGVPVLGGLENAAAVARETAARMLVIAMPSLEAPAMQRVVAICESTGLPFRMVPRLVNVLEGQSMPGDLKEVAIEDLLGRKSVTPDWKLIRGWLGGRTVMVTGAGGSIGSELCRQCARHGAQRIALVEIDELALITIQGDLRRAFPDLEVLPVLGNCGDPAVIAHAMRVAEPDAVFHAAAYKQVPLLEGHLREAVGNNVLATETVARACREAGVGTFVLISTDKAVDPANVLGATKRLAEMVCQSLDDGRASTRYVTVRFGNVLDSAGSVVPLFREQIRKGGRHPLFHDHPGGLPADPAGRVGRGACVHLHARHGRSGADPPAGRADDPPGRQAAWTGHRDRLHRPAPGREAARDAVPRGRALPAHLALEDHEGPGARRVGGFPGTRPAAPARRVHPVRHRRTRGGAEGGGARVRTAVKRS
jgi:FlaA1/EpsC-like NDP-sugar epimerase